MLENWDFVGNCQTISFDNNSSAHWCNIHNTDYYPMAGSDKFKFSTSEEFIEKGHRFTTTFLGLSNESKFNSRSTSH